MKRQLAVVVAIGTLLAIAGTPALAAPPANPLVPASGSLAGFSGGELLGEEMRQLFELPVADNPLAGAGASCFATGNGKVLILWTRPVAPTCTVKPGTPIFLFAFCNDCSNTERPPFFGGETEAGQRQCALAGLPVFDAIPVTIDSRPPVNIYSDRYLAVSPQMTAHLPDPNILGVAAEETTFVAAGWVAMIRPRPPGAHNIRVEVQQLDGTSFISQAIVNVVPGRQAQWSGVRAAAGSSEPPTSRGVSRRR
jgi:hypothetical protein